VVSVHQLDASSGALGMRGAVRALVSPLLSMKACEIESFAATNLTRGGVHSLASALATNRSLTSLELPSNMIYGCATESIATALAVHPALTHLSLDHNPLLDRGGVTLATLLPSTTLAHLSLRFTGVADAACDALGLSLASSSCALLSLRLSGNRITTAGATSLAASLGPLRLLDLTANIAMDGGAALALAKALPTSQLRALHLSGCKVDKKGCSRLAAALPRSMVRELDLSANHFGSEGSDEFAWMLADCLTLERLSLADCDLDDEAADELLEGLSEAKDGEGEDGEGEAGEGEAGGTKDGPRAALRRLDLRWNKLSASKHQRGEGISADTRVDAGSQKQQTAADRQNAHLERTWQEAKTSGKKVYVPKWAREQVKAQGKQSGSKQSGGGA